MAKNVDIIMTRIVEPFNSIQLGHVTLDISLLTSLKNFFAFSISFAMFATSLCKKSNYTTNLNITGKSENPRKLAGQEGFEPPTAGFGDRCSTN